MTDTELKVWAEAHMGAGSSLARGVLRLLEDRDSALKLLAEAVSRPAPEDDSHLSLAPSVADLAALADDGCPHADAAPPPPFDGSAGLSNTVAGRKNEGSGI